MTYRDVAQDRDVTPSDLDWLEDYECDAYEYHDKLVEMGGRPTRQVREKPAGKAIYGKDEIRIVDDYGELQGTVGLDENLTVHHWISERALFKEELDRWEDFRNFQKTMVQVPLLKFSFDSNSMDQRLIDILVRLNDWREFQYYQRREVGFALGDIRHSTEAMKEIMHQEDASREAILSIEVRRTLAKHFSDWDIFTKQMDLEASQKQLAWIESQILAILAEACASLADDPSLQQQLEMKLKQQTNTFDQELKRLGAKSVCLVQYPHQTAQMTQRLCHWGSEITRIIAEYWEWKVFLRWRKNSQCIKTVVNTGEQASGGQVFDLQIWQDYVSYRRDQLDRARLWVAGWQERIIFKANNINTTPRQHLYMLESSISGLRRKVVEFQKDVQIAEFRVRSAEQQLAEIATQQSCFGTSNSTQQNNMHSSLRLDPLDSEPAANVPEDSMIPKDHRATSSTVSPVTGIADLVQLSAVLNKEEEIREKGNDNTKRQPVTVAEATVLDQVIANNDIQMTDAPSHPCPDGPIGNGEGSELPNTPRDDVKDTSMTNFENLVNTCSRGASKVNSKGCSTRVERESPLPTHQASTSRKIRSAKTLDQPFSSRVRKHTGTKPTRNPKASTREKTTAILSATSLENHPTDSPPLRRSQRLKEKAAASLSTAAP